MTTPSLTSSPTGSSSTNPSNEYTFPGSLPSGIVATILGSLTGGLFLIAVVAAIWWARQSYRHARGPWAPGGRYSSFHYPDHGDSPDSRSPPGMCEVLLDHKSLAESHTAVMPLSFTLLPSNDTLNSTADESHIKFPTQAIVSFLIAMPCPPRSVSSNSSASAFAGASAASDSSSSGEEEDQEGALPEVEFGSRVVYMGEGGGMVGRAG